MNPMTWSPIIALSPMRCILYSSFIFMSQCGSQHYSSRYWSTEQFRSRVGLFYCFGDIRVVFIQWSGRIWLTNKSAKEIHAVGLPATIDA